MARKPTGNPVGAPKKEIDWTLFEQLCGLQCTQSEICSMLKVNETTLRKACLDHFEGEDYSALYKRFSETGKCSLRRYQFVQAKTKPNMAIWLGKQWLGQKENPEETVKEAIVDGIKSGLRELLEKQGSALPSKPEVAPK